MTVYKSSFYLPCLLLISCSSKIDYDKADRYIVQSEKEWAKAVATGDTSTIKRIVADDFVGINSKGNKYDKSSLIQESLTAPGQFKTEVKNINVRFFGSAAVANGEETWTKIFDSSFTKSVWTDTWIYRNSKWEVVSAQDQKTAVK